MPSGRKANETSLPNSSLSPSVSLAPVTRGEADREERGKNMRSQAILTMGLFATLALACDSATTRTTREAEPSITQPTTRGYVMARWHDEIPDIDPGECPDGLNVTEADYYPEQWAVFMAERKRIHTAGGYLRWDVDLLPPDACQDPLSQPDPGFLTLDGPATVHGLDLDGVDSRRAASTSASCAHDDFAGHDGATGIDNQYWRLTGCIRGFRPNDLMDRLQSSNAHIKEGGYAILLEISGMDDARNDDEVEIQLVSANGPATVDASGGIMRNVSVAVHENARYHSPVAKGKIVDGILTTEPVDLWIKKKQQTSDNEVWLRDARIRGEVLDDGRVKGVVGAFFDIVNLYSVLNDQNIGDHPQGRNAANSRGFMCAGIYHAMPRVADGHPDPETGRCTSISAAIHFEAVPAFLIRPRVAMAD